MKDILESTRKRLKSDTTALQIFTFAMITLLVILSVQFFSLVTEPAENFQLELVTDPNFPQIQYYAIFVDGEEYSAANYNDYNNFSEQNLSHNIKMTLLFEEGSKILQCLFVFAILFLLYQIFKGIKDGASPFQTSTVKSLRSVAALIVMLELVPGVFYLWSHFLLCFYVELHFTMKDFFLLVLAGVIAMIAEIFHYGCNLQEDVDSIA
ncbi:MAG: hypothetical protein ACI4ES_03890 [Roseburia sp.]